MEREQYIKARKNILEGQVDEDVMKLFYEYWNEFKKEEYHNVDFDNFATTFSTYLNTGFNYHSASGKIINHFDYVHSLQTVKDAQGNVLTFR